MNFDSIPGPDRDLIAHQIGELLRAAIPANGPGSCMPPAKLKLRESCRELILDLPGKLPKGGRIENFVRRQRTWYHQLCTETEAYGYARTIQRGGQDSPHRLIEVVPLPAVARRFRAAIKELDDEPQKFTHLCAKDAVLSLLYVPRYNFYAFVPEPASRKATGWEIGGAYAYLPTKARCRLLRWRRLPLKDTGTALTRTCLLVLLNTLPSAFGVDACTPRRLQQAGLGDRLKYGLRSLIDRWRGPKVPR